MFAVILMLGIIFGSIIIITLGCVWMGTSYSAKKKGLAKGASRREIEQIQQEITLIYKEISELKEQVIDLKGIIQDTF